MLDYLKEKRDAGFFKSLSGLMQACRYDIFKSFWHSYGVFVKLILMSINFIMVFGMQMSIRKHRMYILYVMLLLHTVSWTWMHLRDRTKQRVLAWCLKKAQVSEGGETSVFCLFSFFVVHTERHPNPEVGKGTGMHTDTDTLTHTHTHYTHTTHTLHTHYTHTHTTHTH